MDAIGPLNIQDGATPKFIERVIEIIEHKTCKSGKRKLSLQEYGLDSGLASYVGRVRILLVLACFPCFFSGYRRFSSFTKTNDARDRKLKCHRFTLNPLQVLRKPAAFSVSGPLHHCV